MRRYSQSFLHEVRRFEECNTAKSLLNRTEAGLLQFFEFESRGIRPTTPDPYFTFLCDGKAWWEWTLNFIAEDYLTQNWDGWLLKALDFVADPSGFKQLRARCGCEVVEPDDVINEELSRPWNYDYVYAGLGI